MMGTHSEHLTSFEPLSGILITAERSFEGWAVSLRHRHYAGLYTDCERIEFSRLCSEELRQVIEETIDALCAVPGPGDQAD